MTRDDVCLICGGRVVIVRFCLIAAAYVAAVGFLFWRAS